MNFEALLQSQPLWRASGTECRAFIDAATLVGSASILRYGAQRIYYREAFRIRDSWMCNAVTVKEIGLLLLPFI